DGTGSTALATDAEPAKTKPRACADRSVLSVAFDTIGGRHRNCCGPASGQEARRDTARLNSGERTRSMPAPCRGEDWSGPGNRRDGVGERGMIAASRPLERRTVLQTQHLERTRG